MSVRPVSNSNPSRHTEGEGNSEHWGWLNPSQTGQSQGSSIQGPQHWFGSDNVVKPQHLDQAMAQWRQSGSSDSGNNYLTSGGFNGVNGEHRNVHDLIHNRSEGRGFSTMNTHEGFENKREIQQAFDNQGITDSAERAFIYAAWGIETGTYDAGLGDSMKARHGDLKTISGMNINIGMIKASGIDPYALMDDPDKPGSSVSLVELANRNTQGGADATVQLAAHTLRFYGAERWAVAVRGGKTALDNYDATNGNHAVFPGINGNYHNALASGGYVRQLADLTKTILNDFNNFENSGLRHNSILHFV